MKEQRPYSRRELEQAKASILHAQGYQDKGLEAYMFGLNIPSFDDFKGKRVLDLGAGAHLQFARGLEKAGIKADVVSFTPAFADKSWRDNIEKRRQSDKIVTGMAEELPFADASFDRVVSLDVPEHIGSYERYILYLKEIVRVLAPDGVAYIGPASEMKAPHAGQAIPKVELEALLSHHADVSYHQAHKIHPFQTLTLRKSKHA